jgi:hypothetical protein
MPYRNFRGARRRWGRVSKGKKEVVRRQGDKRIYNGTTHEIGVIFAEDEVSSVLIYRITGVKVADKRGAEKTRDIGVVHSICCL